MYEQQLDRLIVRISGGDDDALAELYEKTNRGVFAFLYSYLDNREDSEDAMQDVYLKVKLHAGSYRHGSNARAWMLQIAKNIALNELAARTRTVDADLSRMAARDDCDGELGITKLMREVLTEEERRIIALHVLWYNRSVKKLRRILKETGK